MNILTQHKNLFLGLFAILVLFAGYKFFFSASDAPALVATEVAPAGQGGAILATLLQLKSLTLNGTLFATPAFRTLRDFSQRLVPEPVGRDNPFAPIGTSK